MAKQKFKLIIIAPPNDYKREIICDGMSIGDAAYRFYNRSNDNTQEVLCYYPIVNTMIDSIEDFTETINTKEGKIINEVK
jgi:hypothetical protein